MRRVRFTYELALRFEMPASRHTFLLRFFPRSDAAQRLWGLEAACSPACVLPAGKDAFGNQCALGHLEFPHQKLTFAARGEAILLGARVREECPAHLLLSTELTQADERVCALSQGLYGTAEEVALATARRISEQVEYRQGATNDQTTAAQALALGAGVCQDMAHLLIAAMRARKMPARYVCGLIPGEGETHAWVEVYDGTGFFGVDPTHVRLTDDSYLRVNVGRDSRDCAINRGVFCGGGAQQMDVRAKLEEL